MLNVATALASSTAAKVAGGALAAVLTVGGAAAGTGNLPDTLQCVTADVAAHVGLTLPRPQIAVEVAESADAVVDDIVTVGQAGQILVAIGVPDLGTTGADASASLDMCAGSDDDATDRSAHGNANRSTIGEADASGHANSDGVDQSSASSGQTTLGDGEAVGDLRITGIVANDGYSAEVVLQTADFALVEFRSATETTSVLISNTDGAIMSVATIEVHADAQASSGSDTSTRAWLNAWTRAYTDLTDLDASVWLSGFVGLDG